nr:serine hydrolase [bacterium]
MKRLLGHRRFAAAAVAGLIFLPAAAPGARAKIPTVAKNPYLSALVLNAGTGEVFFEDNSSARAYPASVIKLMMLLILQEKVEEGTLRLDDPVTVT